MIVAPWILALPWVATPVWVWLSIHKSRRLSEYDAHAPADAPRVSVIIPARDEARSIERCLGSILRTTYANVEVIVVDDHSTDGTGDIAWRVIGDDARARVTVPPPLAAGWYGKQWACAHGASLATGELLLFTDADTWHAPDILARTVAALRVHNADLLTVIGRQEAVSFWEQVGQPPIFLGIMVVAGNTEALNRSRTPRTKAANGQYMLMQRSTYDALDGHAAVRTFVAEDVMFAQTWTAAGRVVHAVFGVDQMSTRMYWSLEELVRGWGKNVWAGGKHIFGDHHVLRGIARWTMPLMPFLSLVPLIALILGLTGLQPPSFIAFGLSGYVFGTAALFAVFAEMRMPRTAALLYPLGCLLTVYIFARASIRGDRTEWKGREYRAA